MSSVAPFLIFFVGTAIVAITGGRLRAAVLLATPLVGAAKLVIQAWPALCPLGCLQWQMKPLQTKHIQHTYNPHTHTK